MNGTINIAYAEDYAMERDGFLRLMSDYPELNFSFCASNGVELMDWLTDNKPDVILLDIRMPIMDGREAFSRIRKKYPTLKIIMFTEYFTNSYIAEFMRKGARAYLSKNNKAETVAETIRRVHYNGICIDPFVYNIIVKEGLINDESFTKYPAHTDCSLSAIEIQVLRLMVQGKECAEIAAITCQAVRTIENIRSRVWRKSKCNTLPELMDFAFKYGLFSF